MSKLYFVLGRELSPDLLARARAAQPEVLPEPGVVLDIDATRYHADRCQTWHVRLGVLAAPLLAAGFPMWDDTDAARHVRGLLDLTLKLRDLGHRVTWRHPETFLHPFYQAELGEILLSFVDEDLRKEEDPKR